MPENNKLPPYPEGHEYYGPFVVKTLTDGWCYGAITENPCDYCPECCPTGDGFAVAPDGSYAGLVWWTDCPWEFELIERPGPEKFFGVFEVRFPFPVKGEADLAKNFQTVLPQLQFAYERWKAGEDLGPPIESDDDASDHRVGPDAEQVALQRTGPGGGSS